MDTVSLITSEKAAAGIKTPNESRRRLNLPRIAGGDTVYLQQQDYSIEAINRRDQDQPAPHSHLPAASDATPVAEDSSERAAEKDAEAAAIFLAKAFGEGLYEPMAAA